MAVRPTRLLLPLTLALFASPGRVRSDLLGLGETFGLPWSTPSPVPTAQVPSAPCAPLPPLDRWRQKVRAPWEEFPRLTGTGTGTAIYTRIPERVRPVGPAPVFPSLPPPSPAPGGLRLDVVSATDPNTLDHFWMRAELVAASDLEVEAVEFGILFHTMVAEGRRGERLDPELLPALRVAPDPLVFVRPVLVQERLSVRVRVRPRPGPDALPAEPAQEWEERELHAEIPLPRAEPGGDLPLQVFSHNNPVELAVPLLARSLRLGIQPDPMRVPAGSIRAIRYGLEGSAELPGWFRIRGSTGTSTLREPVLQQIEGKAEIHLLYTCPLSEPECGPSRQHLRVLVHWLDGDGRFLGTEVVLPTPAPQVSPDRT